LLPQLPQILAGIKQGVRILEIRKHSLVSSQAYDHSPASREISSSPQPQMTLQPLKKIHLPAL